MTPDEATRLSVLRSYAVMDTSPDPALDRITALAKLSFDAPIALVSLVDDTRQWFKSRQGLDACETGRDVAFCAHALPLPRGGVLMVEDATRDPRFAHNPLVTGEPHIRFYAGAVLTSPEGANLGTLCILDHRPRPPLTPLQTDTLRALADLAMSELEVRRARRDEEAKLHLLDMAEAVSGVGRWRLEVATGAVEWSDEVYRIHGVARDSYDPNLGEALAFYEPPERDRVARHLEEAMRAGRGFAFKLHIRRKDGQVRDVVCKAEPERDATGAVVSLVGVFQDVTEHETLLRQVSADRERYRLLTENATDVIGTFSADGAITYLSPAIYKLVGYTPEELVGRRTYDTIYPDDIMRVEREFVEMMARDADAIRIEYRALKKGGGYVWVEGHPTPVLNAAGEIVGFQDVVRDISARREAQAAEAAAMARAEAALATAQESEARYRLLAENANDMISTSSFDSTLLFVTPAVQRLLGYAPEELIGRRTLDLTHPDDLPRVRELFTRLLSAGPDAPVTPYQFRGRHKDGRWLWLEGQPRVQHDALGRPQVFQDVVRDVGERRRIEMELEAAKLEAEAAAQAKADFLANMSHELRTPLTSILGYTALTAEQPELSALSRDYVRRVRTASRALLSTVNDILDFSKLEAGQVAIHATATDVLAVCRDAVELFTPQAAAKDLRLEVETPDGPPPALMVDGERLLQLLLNLVGNGVKFTEAGTVSVVVRHARDRLRLEVRDTGCGIPPEALGRLFRRFSQVDGSSTRSHAGTGLGLAICRGLAELMGGGVAVESEYGRGSTFTLDLPAPRAPVAAGTAAALPALEQLEALRVLVVDDNPANRELARIILAGAGAEAEEAACGADALRVLEMQPFDAVLLDLRMPDLDGATVLRRLRAGGGLNDDIPVLAYTADAPDPRRPHGPQGGFDGVVHKPVRPAELLTALKRAVEAPTQPEVQAHAR